MTACRQKLCLFALLLVLTGCPASRAPAPVQPPPAAPAPATPVPPPVSAGSNGETPLTWQLTSPAFADGDRIPANYTGEGGNSSPPLYWNQPPEGTRELVLICVDPDASGGPFTHWLLYNLLPLATSLPEALPDHPQDTLTAVQYEQGVNDAGSIGYFGPAPPAGKPHRYQFTLYAVSALTNLPAGAKKAQVLRAIEGKVIKKSTLEGLYGR